MRDATETGVNRPKATPNMSAAEFRAARDEMGMTQQQAADQYGLSLNAIKQYELGLRPIPGPVRILTQLFLEKHREI